MSLKHLAAIYFSSILFLNKNIHVIKYINWYREDFKWEYQTHIVQYTAQLWLEFNRQGSYIFSSANVDIFAKRFQKHHLLFLDFRFISSF